MITANQIITVFNTRTDKEKRREVFIPTNIFGVSFYELDSSKFTGGVRSEEITCKIRIPFGSRIEAERTYLPESQYKTLTEEDALFYWTLQKGSYILLASTAATAWRTGAYDLGQPVTKEELMALCHEVRYTGLLITVIEYADNTQRGSQAVRHWRIGGK